MRPIKIPEPAVDAKTLWKIIGLLQQEWRQINHLIWVLEGLERGRPPRGRPPKFETMAFGRKRRKRPSRKPGPEA